MGYAFTHGTSIPYLRNKKNASVIIKNYIDIMSILAWGAGGGEGDLKRKRLENGS